MTDKLYSGLKKADRAYMAAVRYALPNPRRYMAISVLLTIANVTTGIKLGVATKAASLIF